MEERSLAAKESWIYGVIDTRENPGDAISSPISISLLCLCTDTTATRCPEPASAAPAVRAAKPNLGFHLSSFSTFSFFPPSLSLSCPSLPWTEPAIDSCFKGQTHFNFASPKPTGNSLTKRMANIEQLIDLTIKSFSSTIPSIQGLFIMFTLKESIYMRRCQTRVGVKSVNH